MLLTLMVGQTALLAASMAWTYRLGYRNLAHGQAMVWGGVAAGSLAADSGWALPLGALCGAVVSLVAHLGLRGFVQRGHAFAQFVAGLGIHTTLLGLGGLLLGTDAVSMPGSGSLVAVAGGGAVGIVLAVSGALRRDLTYAAEADDPRLASLWGVSSGRRTHALAAAAGAVAGACGVAAGSVGTIKLGQGIDSVLVAWCAVALVDGDGVKALACGGLLGLTGYGITIWAGAALATPLLALLSVVLLVIRHTRGP